MAATQALLIFWWTFRPASNRSEVQLTGCSCRIPGSCVSRVCGMQRILCLLCLKIQKSAGNVLFRTHSLPFQMRLPRPNRPAVSCDASSLPIGLTPFGEKLDSYRYVTPPAHPAQRRPCRDSGPGPHPLKSSLFFFWL